MTWRDVLADWGVAKLRPPTDHERRAARGLS
jgi:hypothetical protein